MKNMSLFKSTVTAALLAGTVVGANAAVTSTTTDLGLLSITATSFGGGSGPGNGFFDYVKFQLPSNGGTGYSVANFSPTFLNGTFNLAFSSLTLFSNPDGIIGTVDDVALATVSSISGANTLALNWAASSGGKMYLAVVGQITGTSGGIYTGAISVAPVIPQVPEPESYAMLLAGLGVMGAIALRRGKSKSE